MKKITALLLSFLLLCTGTATAAAAELADENTSAVISVTVPDTHRITVSAEHARVFYNGTHGDVLTVGRLSTPRLLIRADSGWAIDSVFLNGVDVTRNLYGGYLNLAEPVYEDKLLTVTTKLAPGTVWDGYTIKGRVTLNGEPLSGVELELRSVLKTDTTDGNGKFAFYRVDPGSHSLTALRDGNVIGYLAFELKASNTTNVVLMEDGTYFLSVDQNSAGVELHLELHEASGTLIPVSINGIPKSMFEIPKTGDTAHVFCWLSVMIASAFCMAVLLKDRRKKKI